MENQSISLSPGFIKLLLNLISLVTCFLTFYNTTDATTFTSSSTSTQIILQKIWQIIYLPVLNYLLLK